MDLRRKPPDFNSPEPSRSCSPRSISAAIRQRLAADQARAEARQVALVGSAEFANTSLATTQLSTASPRNSRRSLCGPPALR